MDLLFIVGVALYMAGHGTRGLPNMGLVGSVMMIVAGVLVLVSALS
jgi:hypothetical protein